MDNSSRPLALVTGASSGIGLELAKQFAHNDFDLIIAAEDAELDGAARELEALGANYLRPYLCNRSRSGHYHLTTDTTPRSILPLHLRIPQQRLPA
jgi:NAD(P)-dependent dehydrogenase (short-subunit alcohol dehydrogenase family)